MEDMGKSGTIRCKAFRDDPGSEFGGQATVFESMQHETPTGRFYEASHMKNVRLQRKEQGFTIIELVVVILLLGILTATALPRFMDVQNQAHDAVVQGVLGGLITSSGLFRAQWYAEGQPETVVDYDNLRATTGGYALGKNTANTVKSMANGDDCIEIYESFLQPVGRPTIDSKTSASGAPTTVKAATTDFVAYLDTTNSVSKRKCYFIYTGQYNDSSLGGLPVLLYDAATGSVSLQSAEL
jgi:MSHA pilin protein MshB